MCVCGCLGCVCVWIECVRGCTIWYYYYIEYVYTYVQMDVQLDVCPLHIQLHVCIYIFNVIVISLSASTHTHSSNPTHTHPWHTSHSTYIYTVISYYASTHTHPRHPYTHIPGTHPTVHPIARPIAHMYTHIQYHSNIILCIHTHTSKASTHTHPTSIHTHTRPYTNIQGIHTHTRKRNPHTHIQGTHPTRGACVHIYIYIYNIIVISYRSMRASVVKCVCVQWMCVCVQWMCVCRCAIIFHYSFEYVCMYILAIACAGGYTMGWLWLVGSFKLWVSFAKEPYKRDDIMQKRPIMFTKPTNRSHPILDVRISLQATLMKIWRFSWFFLIHVFVLERKDMADSTKNTPLDIHRIQKIKFHGTNSNEPKISIWICTVKYRGIWASQFRGFRECSIFGGICHTRINSKQIHASLWMQTTGWRKPIRCLILTGHFSPYN